MRLGAYPCKIKTGSLAHKIYGAEEISERHRHRYEVNNEYLPQLAKKGLKASGTSPNGVLCETVELEGHPWFFGCQFHPEYKSKPIQPHPVFVQFVRAALSKGKAVAETATMKKEGEAELASSLIQALPGGVSPES